MPTFLPQLLTVFALTSGVNAGRNVNYLQAALDDEITDLPGLEYMPAFRHFSGYIDIPGIAPNATKHVHYHFIESESAPEKDPVVWWTNGGPGCSGLLGLFTEQGPFKPNAEGILEQNAYRWNKVANMLFVEQPVGVGFSFSDDPMHDYELGDRQAAKDNYEFILGFFQKFPQYLSNEFVISSESWGGHYIPTLSVEIVRQQGRPGASPKLNFVGFLVGNPYTSWVNNHQATVKALVGHSLVSYPTAAAWERQCAHIRIALEYILTDCIELEARMNVEMAEVNPYALSYPVCLDTVPNARLSNRGRAQRTWLLHHASPPEVRERMAQVGVGIIDIADYEPCEDNYLVKYLNQEAVKVAMHVDPGIEWKECSSLLNYDLRDFFVPMEPLYKLLLGGKYGLKMLVYSGDDDSVCGTWGTQKWMHGLGQRVLRAWVPWRDDEGQVAGFVTQFGGNLTLATVAGAGHEVPTYTPDTALKLFMLFLDGTWFDPKAFSPSEEGDGGKRMGLKGAGGKEKEEGMAVKGNEREVSQVAVKTLLRVV